MKRIQTVIEAKAFNTGGIFLASFRASSGTSHRKILPYLPNVNSFCSLTKKKQPLPLKGLLLFPAPLFAQYRKLSIPSTSTAANR